LIAHEIIVKHLKDCDSVRGYLSKEEPTVSIKLEIIPL
jgi:sedoheptulose-bisphosphatase